MIESEELYLLRFRLGRAAEILRAYNTFLARQIIIGPKYHCKVQDDVEQVTDTLLLVFYSFIYSMFDKSGTDFVSTTEPYVNILSEDGRKVRDEAIKVWEEYKTPISKLRNNIGFHGGIKVKSHATGYGALAEIHPYTAELIMTYLGIFFIEIDSILPPSENYNLHIDREEMKRSLQRYSEKLKAGMNDPSTLRGFEELKKLLEERF